MKSDVGSGAILGVLVIFLTLGIIGLFFWISSQSVAKARLQAVSDSAALAAEDSLRGLASGYPCETAEQIVKEFNARLETCHKVSFDIYISVYQEVMGIVLRVQSHAGVGLDSAR